MLVLKYFPDVTFEYVDDRPGDVMLTMAKSEILKRLGWKTQIDIESGISNCFKNLKTELQNTSNE